jgi:hypothetical protein
VPLVNDCRCRKMTIHSDAREDVRSEPPGRPLHSIPGSRSGTPLHRRRPTESWPRAEALPGASRKRASLAMCPPGIASPRSSNGTRRSTAGCRDTARQPVARTRAAHCDAIGSRHHPVPQHEPRLTPHSRTGGLRWQAGRSADRVTPSCKNAAGHQLNERESCLRPWVPTRTLPCLYRPQPSAERSDLGTQ